MKQFYDVNLTNLWWRERGEFHPLQRNEKSCYLLQNIVQIISQEITCRCGFDKSVSILLDRGVEEDDCNSVESGRENIQVSD